MNFQHSAWKSPFYHPHYCIRETHSFSYQSNFLQLRAVISFLFFPAFSKILLEALYFLLLLKKKSHENLTTVYYFSQSSAVLAGFLLYLMLTDSKQAENALTHKTSWCWLAIGSPAEALSLGTWVSLLAGFLHSLSCEFSMCLS